MLLVLGRFKNNHGEGNGEPLQCSCLENPRGRVAWWAAIYGVARVGHNWIDLAVAAAKAPIKYGEKRVKKTADNSKENN